MDVELWNIRKKELKLTFDDLANQTNLSVRTLKSLFNGERSNATTFTVQAIEKALGLDKEQDYNLSPKAKELVELLMELNDNQLEDALSVIKIIAKK